MRLNKITLVLVFILAVSLRLGWLSYRYTSDFRNFNAGDYLSYRVGAEHIREYGDLNNSIFLLRPPLFPFMIYAVHMDTLAVLIANALFGACLAPLTMILARYLDLPQDTGVLAGVIVALDLANIAYSAFLGAEALANITLMIMVVALLRAMRGNHSLVWAVVAGVALILSMLARPAIFLIWTGLAIWLLVAFRQQWRAVLTYVLVCVIGISAWVIHNGVVLNNYTVTTVSTYSLLYYRAASVEHWATGDDMETVYTNLSRRVEKRLGHDTSTVTNGTRHTHYTGDERLSAAMTKTAIKTFIDHPVEYVMTIPIGLGRMFGYSSVLPTQFLPLEIIWNMLLVMGTLVGLILIGRHRQWLLFWCIFLVMGYFTAGTIISQTSGLDTRMRTMLTPFMAMAVAYVAQVWVRRRESCAE